ncbi:MAG: serine hydrolase [Ruminococcus sp.]|nr:serine hydrolase [Ruminococcus sp.]
MKIKKIVSIALSILILLSAVVFAFPASATSTSESLQVEINTADKNSVAPLSTLKSYQSYLDKIVNLKEFTGVAYVTQNGYVLCQSANGMQSTLDNKEMTIDTLFPLGSVSKQFCATAVLLLQEQGKLSVHDTMEKYFPEYEIGKDVTVQNLLNMTSGIRDHVNPDASYKDHEIPTDEYFLYETATSAENKKAITDWLFTQQLKFTPGSSFSYSNANFFLLSIIVEQVSDMNYMDFIKQNIFTPLGMTNSGFYEELFNSPDLAEHSLPDGLQPSEPHFHGLSQGAGDLVSNAKDMDKWLTSISDRTLLSEESYEEMTTDYGYDYGYGIFIGSKDGSIYHGGNIATYESCALTIPEKDINIFVVTNNVVAMNSKNLPMPTFAQGISNKIRTSMFGDVNGDGDITVLDATAIQMHVAQLQMLTDEQAKRGDTNGDGEVSVLDATDIQRLIAKL